MQQEKTVQIIFIRHGESAYNDKAAELRQKLGIGPTWEEYKANPEFMQFKYSQEMLDCGLSQHGKQQCMQQQGKYDDVDIVLVSPLNRALSSCNIIFKNYRKGPIIVQPIISESLRCACDVSYNLPLAKQSCGNFDFSRIEGKQSSWYIQNQVQQKQKIYEEWLKQQNAQTYEDRAKMMNEYMKKTYNFQDSFDLIKRSRKIRQKLKQYAIEYKCEKIGVVSHFYTIGYTVSDNFNEKGKPQPKIHIENAIPYRYILKLDNQKQP